MKQPLERSPLRRKMGKLVYTFLKKVYWNCPFMSFARLTKSDENYNYPVYKHSSVLLRKLQGVEEVYQQNKVINLTLAVAKLSGMTLFPANRFSYWKYIGKPSRRKGYVDGLVLRDGKVIYDVGGGLCQLSNLLFWLVAHTPLTIVERWRHSYDVFPDSRRTLPFGSGATCSYPYIDFQFENRTNYRFKIKLWLDETHLHGEIYADRQIAYRYEVYEKEHQFVAAGWDGKYIRKNKLFRKKIDSRTGEVIEDVDFISNEALTMYDPLLSSQVE